MGQQNKTYKILGAQNMQIRCAKFYNYLILILHFWYGKINTNNNTI